MTAPAGFAGDIFLEDLSGLERTGFAACAFFTPGDGYEAYARRLAASCRRFGVPFSILRAPAVHCSVSLRGTQDLAFCKPSFIAACLDRLGGAAVAYLDVDTLLMAPPASFHEAIGSAADFAIYNWLEDAHNEAYLPANRSLASAAQESGFYLFSHRVEWRGGGQLVCSGVTQFYRDSAPARALLARWREVIAANPRSADDQCLNSAWNNPGADDPAARPLWLDKAYARCPWWPHVQPVVLHPAIPALEQPFQPVGAAGGPEPVHLERCARNEIAPVFPRDGGVDVRTGVIFRLDASGRPQPLGRYPGRFWVYDEDGAPLSPT